MEASFMPGVVLPQEPPPARPPAPPAQPAQLTPLEPVASFMPGVVISQEPPPARPPAPPAQPAQLTPFEPLAFKRAGGRHHTNPDSLSPRSPERKLSCGSSAYRNSGPSSIGGIGDHRMPERHSFASSYRNSASSGCGNGGCGGDLLNPPMANAASTLSPLLTDFVKQAKEEASHRHSGISRTSERQGGRASARRVFAGSFSSAELSFQSRLQELADAHERALACLRQELGSGCQDDHHGIGASSVAGGWRTRRRSSHNNSLVSLGAAPSKGANLVIQSADTIEGWNPSPRRNFTSATSSRSITIDPSEAELLSDSVKRVKSADSFKRVKSAGSNCSLGSVPGQEAHLDSSDRFGSLEKMSVTASGKLQTWEHWRRYRKSGFGSVRMSAILKEDKKQAYSPRISILHRIEDRFYLDPHSQIRLFWDFLCSMFLLYDLLMVPFQMAFTPSMEDMDYILSWVGVIFWTADMGISSRTAYYRNGSLVSGSRAMCWRYARTWLPIDLVIVAAEWLTVALHSEARGGSVRVLRTLRMARYLRSLRLLRVGRLRRFIQAMQDKMITEWSSLAMNLSLYSLGLVLLSHLIACLWFAVGLDQHPGDRMPGWVSVHSMMDASMGQRYLKSMHWALAMFASSSDVYPQTLRETLVADCVIVISIIVFSSLIAMVSGAVTQICALGAEHWRQQWLLTRYLRDAHVSHATTTRIQRYLQSRAQWMKNHVTEDQVLLLEHLSEPLRNKLKNESLLPHVCGHPVFLKIKAKTILFVGACSSTTVAAGDVLFTCNAQALWAYVVVHGEFAYWPGLHEATLTEEALNSSLETEVSEGGDEDFEPRAGSTRAGVGAEIVTHGQWVSEGALWAKIPHFGDLEAKSVCQLIEISSEKFAVAVQSHVELHAALVHYARAFVDRLNELGECNITDVLPSSIWEEILPGEKAPAAPARVPTLGLRNHSMLSFWKCW